MDCASALAHAVRRLAEAEVSSPEFDASELLAHVLGLSRGQLMLTMMSGTVPLGPGEAEQFEGLVARRVRREPLQHLTGVAHFRYVELEVGPGVFVPRPETELLAGWVIDHAKHLDRPVLVDLCTGSGAVAKSFAHEVPEATIYAVELSEQAHAWAERNLAGTGVSLILGDAATALPELAATVDIISINPPYIPLDAWESVAAEARDFDPHLALFSGDDGLELMRRLEAHAALLLKPGGLIAVEHADVQGESAPAIFSMTGRWEEVRDHRDLADRPRFVTARLAR